MGSIPKFASKLCMWVESGVVKEQNKITPNIGDFGVTCMFEGYNTNDGDNVYSMWNPDTKRIHNTCEMIWLKMIFIKRN